MKLSEARIGSTVNVLGQHLKVERKSFCGVYVSPLRGKLVEINGHQFYARPKPVAMAASAPCVVVDDSA